MTGEAQGQRGGKRSPTGAPPSEARRRTARALEGFVDAVLAALLLMLIGMTVWRGVVSARTRAETDAAVAEARSFYDALKRYHETNRAYPDVEGSPRFERDTLDPLRRRGYYTGPLTRYLLDGKVDAYDAPDDRGPNREFWAEMTLRANPRIRLLVADSDDAPLADGSFRDGVFLVRDGEIEEP